MILFPDLCLLTPSTLPVLCGQLSHTVVLHLPGIRQKRYTAESFDLDCTDIPMEGLLIVHFKEFDGIFYLTSLGSEVMDC